MAKRSLTALLSIAMLAFLISCTRAEPEIQSQENPNPPIVGGEEPPTGGDYFYCYWEYLEYDLCLKRNSQYYATCDDDERYINACPNNCTFASEVEGKIISYHCENGYAPPTGTAINGSPFWCYGENINVKSSYGPTCMDGLGIYKSWPWPDATKEELCKAHNTEVVDVCPSNCLGDKSSHNGITFYECKKSYGTECNGYCRWDDECVRIATDPDGKYGTAIATCEAATANCTNYSLRKEVFTNDLCKGKGTPGSFTDSRDGKSYKSVKIGTQTWMAENLNYDTKTDGSKCYANNEANCTQYGRLYNGPTAKTACPAGWHLPTDAEWRVLEDYVVYNPNINLDVAEMLKAKSGWNAKAGNGTDDYGFAALPGGYYGPYAGGATFGFRELGEFTAWWTNEVGEGVAYTWSISEGYIGTYPTDLNSVRCLKNP